MSYIEHRDRHNESIKRIKKYMHLSGDIVMNEDDSIFFNGDVGSFKLFSLAMSDGFIDDNVREDKEGKYILNMEVNGLNTVSVDDLENILAGLKKYIKKSSLS